MVLDYVIATPAREWLATEHDKVAALTTRFNVPIVDLPRRRYRSRGDRLAPTYRYFVNKLPIAVANGEPAVEFVYLVLDKTGAGLETFLDDHARMLARLPVSTIIAICPRQLDGLPGLRFHDLRHTVITELAEMGVADHVSSPSAVICRGGCSSTTHTSGLTPSARRLTPWMPRVASQRIMAKALETPQTRRKSQRSSRSAGTLRHSHVTVWFCADRRLPLNY